MASPFRMFRKHQKAFMAIAAVLAIFIFVIGDALMGYVQQAAGGGSDSPDEVVTTWNGGKLTYRDITLMKEQRYFISDVLKQISYIGYQRYLARGGEAVEYTPPRYAVSDSAPPEQVILDSVIRRMLADLARKTGMTVSDEMINNNLYRVGYGQVTDAEIRQIMLAQRQMNPRMAENWLFSGLHDMLLGDLYLASAQMPYNSVLPQQHWQDWRNFNERISLEAAILPVDSFLDQTPEPEEGELKAFYEKYKETVPGGYSMFANTRLELPEIGFAVPRRVKLKYLMGDVNAWTDKLLAEVTDEEIADYYERNKRMQFVKFGADDDLFRDFEDTDSEETGPEETDTEETETEETVTAEPAEGATNEDDVTIEADSETVDTETAPAEEEEEEEETAEEPSDNESADDAPAAEEAEGEVAVEEETVEEDTAEEDDNVEYEPLEDVKEQIRRQLANDKAVLKLKEELEGIYTDLNTDFNRYSAALVVGDEDDKAPPVPERLTDLSGLAKEYGLAYEETGLVNVLELQESENTMVGRAVDVESGQRTVTQAAFSNLKLYEPLLAQDLDGYWYLVVKTEDEPAEVPKFEDIREEVLAQWKLSQAAKLAQEKAEELAKEAQESGSSLATFFEGKPYEVTTTDMFSQLTFGTVPAPNQQAPPKLNEAPPLTGLDQEMMESAFKLKEGEVTSFLNFSESDAYVIRLAQRERTLEELHRTFLSQFMNSQAVQVLTQMRRQNMRNLLQQELLERSGLDMERLREFLNRDSKNTDE